MIDRFEQARNISIVEYLDKCGYQATNKHGKFRSYYSPIGKESNPSFKVNTAKNRFCDYHSNKSGSILDLVIELEPMVSTLTEAADFLLADNTVKIGRYMPPKIEKKGLEIISVEDIKSQNLIDYFVDGRKIDINVLMKYCKEVSFSFPYGKRPNRIYRAVGFENSMGGFELRSSFMKVASAPKSFSKINGIKKTDTVNITEGFVDFLSALSYFKIEAFKNTTYILNGVGQINVLKPLLQGKKINYFGDSDKAGDEVLGELANVTDYRSIYEFYNDFNSYIKSL